METVTLQKDVWAPFVPDARVDIGRQPPIPTPLSVYCVLKLERDDAPSLQGHFGSLGSQNGYVKPTVALFLMYLSCHQCGRLKKGCLNFKEQPIMVLLGL